MKIIHMRTALILGSIMIPLAIAAGPKSITITNQSGEAADFEIELKNNEIKATPEIADLRSRTFTFANEINGIRSRKNTAIALDVSQYSELITVIYDGRVLLEESAYKLSQQSPIREQVTALRQNIAARLAVAWQLGGTVLQQLRMAWNRRSSSEFHLSIWSRARIINNLDFDIAYSPGRVQYEAPKTIKPQESAEFSLANNPVVYIYDNTDKKTELRIIDLQKYIDNPKQNADLEITLQKRYALSNRLFGWMPRWSDITYSVRWVKEEPFNQENYE